ncbi:MAG TPA: hypothetical protein VFY99_09935 [Solirubrobacterales bacterium]
MRKVCLGAVVATTALIVPVAPASAAPLATTTDCDAGAITHPFAPWGVNADYVLAPDGAVENGAGEWLLSGGSSIASGNSPFYANSAGDSHSLLIPKGGTAETGTMCIGNEHPTIRFFAKNDSAGSSTLEVRIAVETSWGREHSLPVGLERGNTDWEPSTSMRLIVNYLNLRPDTYTPAEFQFTARNGDWRIDDVYVDPRRN